MSNIKIITIFIIILNFIANNSLFILKWLLK